ncbi:MAG: LSM domain-containing protein [Candidatus Odinarchaeia archaeon]
MERQPIKLLAKALNNLVLVKLKNKKEFIGRLTDMDVYMNIVLSSAEEIEDDKPVARYGEVFIRGNNILYIKPDVTDSWKKQK